LVINKKGIVLGGNHRLRILKEIFGKEHEIDCVEVDLSPKEEKILALALNKIHGDVNPIKLKEIIADISAGELVDIGFNLDEIKFMNLDIDLSKVFNSADISSQKDIPEPEAQKCPKCGYDLGYTKRRKGVMEEEFHKGAQ
jgi:hypothetical protein